MGGSFGASMSVGGGGGGVPAVVANQAKIIGGADNCFIQFMEADGTTRIFALGDIFTGGFKVQTDSGDIVLDSETTSASSIILKGVLTEIRNYLQMGSGGAAGVIQDDSGVLKIRGNNALRLIGDTNKPVELQKSWVNTFSLAAGGTSGFWINTNIPLNVNGHYSLEIEVLPDLYFSIVYPKRVNAYFNIVSSNITNMYYAAIAGHVGGLSLHSNSGNLRIGLEIPTQFANMGIRVAVHSPDNSTPSYFEGWSVATSNDVSTGALFYAYPFNNLHNVSLSGQLELLTGPIKHYINAAWQSQPKFTVHATDSPVNATHNTAAGYSNGDLWLELDAKKLWCKCGESAGTADWRSVTFA